VEVDPSFLDAEESYKLLTGVVVPRPIAWISTLGSNGQVNVAPFSAFTFVSTQPPMLAVSLGRRLGVPKDTARNIGSRREFVVNIANFELLDSLHQSGTEYPEEISEVELLNLKTLPGERIKTPPSCGSTSQHGMRTAQKSRVGDYESATCYRRGAPLSHT
jgi:flavin reductase (DIM6/NTAB) family NADH-FMN oxidoreductase RutF